MPKKNRVNGQTLRDWLNVIAAVGALLVGIVSFWTTARISGLEDYLRSEIGRRNSELNAISARSERAQLLADRRAEEVSKLQFSADELAASFASTQTRLEQAKGALGGVQAQLDVSRGQLSDLDQRSSMQVRQLELLNRRRVYQGVGLSALWQMLRDEERAGLGQAAYDLVVSSAPGPDENDLIPYYDQMRRSAAFTCQPLKSFAREMLKQKSYPKYPEPPGRRVTDNPFVRMMTKVQEEEWDKAQKEHSRKWEEVSTFNRTASKYNFALQQYAADSARRCACLALATPDHPVGNICPGLTLPELPERPDGT